jgi:hypothetical protein
VCVLIVTQKPKNTEESDTTVALPDDEPLLTHADVVDSKEEQEAVDVFPPKSALTPAVLTAIPATRTPTPIPPVPVTLPIPARPTPNPVPPIVSLTKTSVVRPAVNAVASAARTASTCVYTHRPLSR